MLSKKFKIQTEIKYYRNEQNEWLRVKRWQILVDFNKLVLQMGYVQEFPFVISMKDNGQLGNSRSMDRYSVNRSTFGNE